MRIIGLDVGTKTIGIAVSDPFGWTAQGITTLMRKSMTDDIAALRKLTAEYEAEQILIGLPLNMNGTRGPSAENAERLGSELEKSLGLPVLYQDERLSTAAMQKVLISGDVSRGKRKQVIDKLAAVYILQGYLDKQRLNQDK